MQDPAWRCEGTQRGGHGNSPLKNEQFIMQQMKDIGKIF